jgi:hypothetical protein
MKGNIMTTNPVWTELSAVNFMLLCIKEAPVASLDESDSSALYTEASVARGILGEVSIELQANGWTFNYIKEETLSRDTNNKVPLPVDTLEVRASDPQYDYFASGGYLYDRANRTTVFSIDPVVDRVKFVAFDELPPVFAQYVSKVASKRFVDRMRGQGNSQFLDQEITRLRALVDDMDSHQRVPTIFDNYRGARMVDLYNNPVGGNVRR